MIKTFRGLLADGGQDQIYLAGGDSTKGYRIAKFQALSNYPRGASPECVLKIYKVSQTTAGATDTIDFNDQTLLAALYYEGDANNYYTNQTDVIFDREIFNQDIYITCKVSDGTMNYYLELEEVTMSDAEAANVNFVAALLHT